MKAKFCPGTMQLLLFSFLLIAVSVADPVLAAKRRVPEPSLWQYHYYGILGKDSRISMILSSLRNGQLVGSYHYVKIGVPISLAGKIEADGSFDLVEKTTLEQGSIKTEQITGTIRGRVDTSFQNIQGTWSSPDKKKSFPIKLSQGVLVDSKAIEDMPDNHGVLTNVKNIALDSVNSFGDLIADILDDRRIKKTCTLTSSESIGSFGGKEYRLLEFEESGTWLDGSPFKDNYSVLFEIITDKAKAFWIYKDIGDGSSLYEIKLLNEGPYPVFEATYNSGGTRPAWYDFIIRRPSGFSLINTEKLEEAVFKIAEDNGYVPHSTLYFDFVKRQASTQLYKPEDPMCCGSAEISLTFELEHDALMLKDYKINVKQ